MAALTPAARTALEVIVGVREPYPIDQATLVSLVEDGWCRVDSIGQISPTLTGIRATAPQYMKDITP